MNYLTQKQFPRRAFLRGVGATVALPFLDAMVPAGRSRAVAATTEKTRLICIEEVHGLAGCNNWGASKFLFAPETTGRDFTLVPDNPLSTLEPFRKQMTIVSNTDARNAEAFALPEIGGDHFRSSAVFLTQSHPKQTQGSDLFAGTSLDQLYAKRAGQTTPLPSMQFCIENLDQAGGCTYNYSCAYTDTISWASPTRPLPMIRDPRVVFDQMFGVLGNGSAAERRERRQQDLSILDWVRESSKRLERRLGAADRVRLGDYLDNVREIERRLQAVERRNDSGEPRELPMAPRGVPDSFADHVKLMFDLQMLAFRSDITRVFSFKLGRDGSNRVYKESGSTGAFHIVSHHAENPERVRELAKINEYHVSTLPYLLTQLKETSDGDGTMLDNSIVIYGSPMGNPNQHNHKRVPFLVAGHGGGAIKGGVHLKAKNGTPLSNVMLSLLHTLGHDDLQSFGDSEGTFSWE